jgi:adenylate kinase
MNELAYAMVSGDTKAVARYYEDLVRYGGKMNRRDCEEFLREFRAEMEERVPSKQQRAVSKEKAKRRHEMRELEKQLGIESKRKR